LATIGLTVLMALPVSGPYAQTVRARRPATAAPAPTPAPDAAPIDYFRLFPGFIGEVKNEEGWTTGFAAANPWGQYTAYLMATNAKGQRTVRIEHYVPRSDGRGLQGSSMYLLEGRDRALLIDTANPAQATEGVNDLKTVVRYILGHDSDGAPKANPLDFVVANTHSHGDHIGENKRMSDRTVYYMDLDWPANAPPNYVPIRAGGGPTAHGKGTAVAQIDLGERKVTAVAMPPHTAGSTGYLDAENQMLFSGDAEGSGFVWAQIGPLTRYQQTTHEVAALTAALPKLAVFGAHFYQYAFGPRKQPPIGGRPADRQYLLDQAALADGILDGTIVGEPYEVGRETVWATLRSAQIVYSLATLYPPGTAPASAYHAIQIPSVYPAKWQVTDAQKKTLDIKTDLHLITGPKGSAEREVGDEHDIYVGVLVEQRANRRNPLRGPSRCSHQDVLAVCHGQLEHLTTDGRQRHIDDDVSDEHVAQVTAGVKRGGESEVIGLLNESADQRSEFARGTNNSDGSFHASSLPRIARAKTSSSRRCRCAIPRAGDRCHCATRVSTRDRVFAATR
jgi:glyoxylase-like metal-dependent hydrolase (beta-lactamase superfamily II)